MKKILLAVDRNINRCLPINLILDLNVLKFPVINKQKSVVFGLEAFTTLEEVKQIIFFSFQRDCFRSTSPIRVATVLEIRGSQGKSGKVRENGKELRQS